MAKGTETEILSPFLYISKSMLKKGRDVMAPISFIQVKGSHLFFKSQDLKLPDLVFDEDGFPYPLDHAEYEDQFCRIAWASDAELIGNVLPEWFYEWCSDVRDPELPADMTRGQLESYIFEPMTVEQLSLM